MCFITNPDLVVKRSEVVLDSGAFHLTVLLCFIDAGSTLVFCIVSTV